MNLLDPIVLFFSVLFVWAGYQKGLIGQFVSLGGLVFSFYLAIVFYKYLIPFLLLTDLKNPVLLSFVSFFVLFFLILISIRLLNKSLSNSIAKTQLEGVNKILGGIFGFLKFFLILVIAKLFYFYFFVDFLNVKFQTLEGSLVFQKLSIILDVFIEEIPYKPEYEEFTIIYSYGSQ